MAWYYVEAGQQAGPVNEDQFQDLVRAGKILPDTLVWREGMANWQPCREAVPNAVPPQSTPPPASQPAGLPGSESGAQAVCSECGRTVPQSSTVQYGSVRVCDNCRPSFLQRMQGMPSAVAPGQLRYAGFWIRLVAKLIDSLILGVVLGIPIFFIVFGSLMAGGRSMGNQPNFAMIGLNLIIQFVYTACAIAYNGFFLGRFGATPGKMVFGLKVVLPDASGISYGRAFGRSAAEFLSGLICYIGYIIAAFDAEKRSLHDHIANTRVIYTR